MRRATVAGDRPPDKGISHGPIPVDLGLVGGAGPAPRWRGQLGHRRGPPV